jgi:hypothetical protein
MSANYFLKSISFNHYRGLDGLDIPTFRRINLIGGFNGTGKSSLLESIFFLLDRRGPIALTRPFAWRGIAMNGKSSLDQFFSQLDSKKNISIVAETSGGKLKINMGFGAAPRGLTIHVPGHPVVNKPEFQQSLSNDLGLNIETEVNGMPDDGLFAMPMPDGVAVNLYRAGASKIPVAALISPSTRNSPQATRMKFSLIVRRIAS